MSGLAEYAGLSALILWLVFRALRLVAIRENALPVGFAIVLIIFAIWPDNPIFAALVALFSPFGVLFPALALRSITRSLGFRPKPFHWAELLGFVLAYSGFLAAAAGVLPFDLFAYGYSPIGATCVTLFLCAMGFIRNCLFLPSVGLISMALWTANLGSSNAFDNVTHLALLPLAVVALISNILRRLRPTT